MEYKVRVYDIIKQCTDVIVEADSAEEARALAHDEVFNCGDYNGNWHIFDSETDTKVLSEV